MLKFINHNRNLLLKISEKFETPTYVYFEEIIEENVQKYFNAFKRYEKFKLMYAYKANTNPVISRMLKDLNLGADVVSEGELRIARQVNLNPKDVIFTSNGKTDKSLELALNLGCIINIDGFDEIEIVDKISKRIGHWPKPRVSFRINPEVNPHTHDKIATGVKESKFGINFKQAVKAYKKARQKNFEILGIHCHIGSQITDVKPFIEEAKKISDIVLDLHKAGINLKFIDLGGGLGIDYLHEEGKDKGKENDKNSENNVLTHNKLADAIIPIIENLDENLGYKVELILEPGRSIVGNAGILLTNVLSIKRTPYKNFINVDAGFNDLIRPAMYNAYHKIVNLSDWGDDLSDKKDEGDKDEIFDIAGNLCESGDILGKDRKIKAKRNDILAIMDTGAYGFSMASNYNSMPKPAEILITKDKEIKVLRKREFFEDLMRTAVF